MTRYRVVWIDDTTIKATRPITMGLAYDVLGHLLAAGTKAKVERRTDTGRWTALGTATPARGRTVTIGPDAIG